MLKHFLLLVCIFGCHQLVAQSDSILVTKNFKFTDGVYLTFAAFQNNQPDYVWKELKSNLFSNPQTFLTQVEYLAVKENEGVRELSIDSIWGFSLNGIPYMQLPAGSVNFDLPTFAGMQVRGKLCFFTYEKKEWRTVPMSAYNPLTGKPFRTANIKREQVIEYPKLLDFETGEIQDFTYGNFLKIVENDRELHRAVKLLETDEIAEKLFKCLLIYDDRNPVYIK